VDQREDLVDHHEEARRLFGLMVSVLEDHHMEDHLRAHREAMNLVIISNINNKVGVVLKPEVAVVVMSTT